MKRATTSVMSNLVHLSWATINARLNILASEEESAYYAWADEHLDAPARRLPRDEARPNAADEEADARRDLSPPGVLDQGWTPRSAGVHRRSFLQPIAPTDPGASPRGDGA